ncbi:TRAP transporter large permease [Salinarimonas sp. NSM]|uniref:TRAP transporter large permease n=1 Tax=Salinarimonas sp. NSM TaxID=3458003 RepID=UPI004035D489
MIVVALAFLVLMALGVPIVLAIGSVAALYVLVFVDVPIVVVAHRFYTGINNFTLLAIPFFVLSGLLMEAGGLSRRIVDLASALVGWVRGGLLMVAVVASTALAAMSGSGSADAAAVTTVLQAELRKRNYDIDFAAALIAGSATLAQIIPPSLMLVIIAVQNNLSVGALFLAGVVPGLLACVLLLVVAWRHARGKPELAAVVEPFSAARVGTTFVAAIPAIGMAVLILGGIIGGIMTPTEAAGTAVVYAMAVGMLVHRELKPRMLPAIFVRAATFSAGLLLLVATANILNWLAATSGDIDRLAAWMGSVLTTKLAFLVAINVVLMLLGMFVEGIALILLLGSVLTTLGGAFGIDPHQMAVIIVFNCAIGLITPPFGATLFVTAMVAGRPFVAVARRAFMPWLALTLALAALTAFPTLSLGLPRLAGFID